jgi:pilus assembly protein Flp/PilA
VFLLIYLYSKARAIWATRDQGASAVEYGLLIAGIAAVIVVTVITLGGKVHQAFTNTCTNMTAGTAGSTGTC